MNVMNLKSQILIIRFYRLLLWVLAAGIIAWQVFLLTTGLIYYCDDPHCNATGEVGAVPLAVLVMIFALIVAWLVDVWLRRLIHRRKDLITRA